jgi:hypothetical protein
VATQAATLQRILNALELAGVEITEDGVRLIKRRK